MSASDTLSIDGNTLPNCIPLCLRIKLEEAEQLAPVCNLNDINCLCSHSNFVTAYRQCLFDNCATPAQTTLGRQTFASICADTGAALYTYSAVTSEGLGATAAISLASVLALSVSGSDVPTPSFDVTSAIAAASARYSSQIDASQSAAAGSLSQAAQQASASLSADAAEISMSFQNVLQSASIIEQQLETQLSGSALSSAEAQITATLSFIQIAASSKISQQQAAAQASLASRSDAIFDNPGLRASPSAAVQDTQSAGLIVRAITWCSLLTGFSVALAALL